MQRIKKGDKVVVIAGKDKGRTGEVVQVFPKEDRAVVSGINVVRRHQRQTQTTEAGIITKEAPVHENVKQAIVAASELDTRLVMRPLRNTERVLNNAAVERIVEKEKALGDKLTFADIIDEVAGVYPRIMQNGEMDLGAWSCGMVAGLIHDIPSCEDLIERIMKQAEDIIRARLVSML